jgi:putative acetyltransferase
MEDKKMKEYAARCGIYCGDCNYREKMSCPGCQKAEGKIFWGECPVAGCVMSKGFHDCSECPDLPCDLLKSFAYDKEQGDDGLRIRTLEAWKSIGFDKWLEEKMNIIIRPETKQDHRRVEEVTREAFWNLYRPGCDEHYTAHILREHGDFIPELDLVAELDGKIVGSIMYTRSYVINEKGEKTVTATFGPVCVLPEFQRKGIGSKLIRYTLKLAEEMGFPAVLIFGDAHNYCRHGFKNGIDLGVSTYGGIFPLGFLVLELKKGFFAGHKWEFSHSDAYNLSLEEAEKFDLLFEPKAKEYRPSQDVFSMQIRATLK